MSHHNHIQSAPVWPFICKDFTVKSAFFFIIIYFQMKNFATGYLGLIDVTLLKWLKKKLNKTPNNSKHIIQTAHSAKVLCLLCAVSLD